MNMALCLDSVFADDTLDYWLVPQTFFSHISVLHRQERATRLDEISATFTHVAEGFSAFISNPKQVGWQSVWVGVVCSVHCYVPR